MLQLSDITQRYQQRTVFTAVSLHLVPATIGAVVGANGVGKTTLLRIAARLLRPSVGQVRHGWPANGRAQLAYLGEADYLFGAATVQENLRDVAQLCGRDAECLETVVALWGLAAWWRRPCAALSRGERRRVALARAWLMGERLLLLDEPTVGLDDAGLRTLHAALAWQRQRGGSCLMALQDDTAVSAVRTQRWDLDPHGLHQRNADVAHPLAS